MKKNEKKVYVKSVPEPFTTRAQRQNPAPHTTHLALNPLAYLHIPSTLLTPHQTRFHNYNPHLQHLPSIPTTLLDFHTPSSLRLREHLHAYLLADIIGVDARILRRLLLLGKFSTLALAVGTTSELGGVWIQFLVLRNGLAKC